MLYQCHFNSALPKKTSVIQNWSKNVFADFTGHPVKSTNDNGFLLFCLIPNTSVSKMCNILPKPNTCLILGSCLILGYSLILGYNLIIFGLTLSQIEDL